MVSVKPCNNDFFKITTNKATDHNEAKIINSIFYQTIVIQQCGGMYEDRETNKMQQLDVYY